MTLEETLRIEGGKVLATLVRLTGDFDIAEDALQDALVVALEKWSTTGVPDNPAAWLTSIGKNKALDRLRRESKRNRKEQEALRLLDEPDEPEDGVDDRLRLIFTCCHPALSPDARVALALRVVCGLSTGEVARAFLVEEPTMSQRISRAKKKIATAHIPYRVPADHELPDRLPAVLAVLYLIFTTGHHAPTGPLDARIDLTVEAIRLARLLVALMPDESECAGLLALLLAVHARRDARVDEDGSLILLADQDRSRWDDSASAEAARIVDAALRRRLVGPYQVQAAIATLHSLAPSYGQTDWQQIVVLYRILEHLQPTPVVRVNRAIAEAEVSGPERGLQLLDGVEGVGRWHLYWSAKADLQRRAGKPRAALEAYRRALDLPMNDADRRFLLARIDELHSANATPSHSEA